MAPRSEFSREHETQVKEQCEQLIRGTLQDNATPENMDTALAWCLQCIAEHRHDHVDDTLVRADFRQLVEKLRIHSQLDAAEYLEDQRAEFIRTRLSRRHTREAHSFALQTVMLLARQPTRVPLRMVRSLRAIREGRKARAEQQRRGASEQAHDRKVLLELELRQIAEAASQPWMEAWAEPDLVSESGHRAPTQPLVSEAATTEASLPPSSPSRSPRGKSQRTQELVALPRLHCGSLPRLTLGSAVAVSEGALVEMALQMFAGYAGDRLDTAAAGHFIWGPVAVPHLDTGALRAMLEPLAAFGSMLRDFRQFAAVVQAAAPWVGHEELRRRISRMAMARRLGVRELAHLAPVAEQEQRAAGATTERARAPDVLGLCWHSACLGLEELVESVAADFQRLQVSSFCSKVLPGGPPTASLTLMKLGNLVAPYSRNAWAVKEVIDAALAAVALRCCEQPAASWAEAAAEQLVAHLSRAVRSTELVGAGSSWLSHLWCASLRPPLRVMRQWGATGTIHDPCCEFGAVGSSTTAPGTAESTLGALDVGHRRSGLIPEQIASSGRHIRALREWSQFEPLRMPRDEMLCLKTCLGSQEVSGGALPADSGLNTNTPPYVPLPVKLEVCILGPTQQLADKASRPLLLRVLQEDSRGLLRHLDALRAVAFLEQEGLVAPLIRCLFEYLTVRRQGAPASSEVSSALELELNAALSEGVEQARDTKVQQLCSRHMGLALVQGDGGNPQPGDICSILDCVQLVFLPLPPLDRILNESVSRAYSLIMGLLLRVHFSKAAMQEVHGSPLFGLCDRHRRARSRLLPLDFIHFAHACDLFRMEVSHFVGCTERYLQVSVLQGSTRTLQQRLQRLIESGPEDLLASSGLTGKSLEWGTSGDAHSGHHKHDVVEHATRLHGEYLQQLLQDCFLVPELHVVLTDIHQLLNMAAELRDLLVDLVAILQLNEPGRQDSVVEEDSVLGDRPLGPLTDHFSSEAWQSDAGVLFTKNRLVDLQREFRGSVRYLLQVLKFPPGRTAPHQVASFCSQLNFSGFYGEE